MTQLPEGFVKIEKNPQTEPATSFKKLPEGFEKVEKITELPEDFVREDDLSIDDIKKMQSEGVPLSDKLQRKLFKAEDERSFLDKVSGAAGAFIPAAADIIGDVSAGAVELANKAVVQPAALTLTGGYGDLNSERAQKVFKERNEALRSGVIGVSKDIEETANAAVRFAMFGSSATDKLFGKSDEERFRAWQNRQTMRELEAKSIAENPDRTNYLLSQNPLIQSYVEYEAKKMGLTPEEVEKVKRDYIQTMLDQGLTKDQINEKVSAFGEIFSPAAIPGAGIAGGVANKFVGKALSKVTAPIASKIGNLTARAIETVAGGTEFAANKVLQGTELLQTGARKIGEYAINDPDTWIKGTVNTAILPVVGVAKPVASVARVVKDIARQVDAGGSAGRRGILERTGRDALSGKIAKGIFGPESRGGVARAKVGDWMIRQANAVIQPGVNAVAMNTILGLPDIETAEDLGFMAGTGFGIGVIGGSRAMNRVGGLIDPSTTMAQKITNLVTPDPAAYRRDEDADIKRFMAQASPEIQQNITDLSNIESRKAAVDARIANLEKERDAQIEPDDVAFKQRQIDGFLKQKEALSKATPETQAEATRQTALAFIDAYDLAQSTGGVAGLRGVNIAVLDPANADQFFRDLYGDSLQQAEVTINLLSGIPSLTETDSTKLTEARQLLQKFQNDVQGAKSARGFALQEDNTDPNSEGFVPPHLRRINQQGATAVINADLIKHMTSQGLNLRHTIQHEVQHAVQQFDEVNKMLAPIRGQLFDQKIKNDDGTIDVYQQGLYSDEDLDRYATQYAKMMSPSDNGASFYAQFGGEIEKMRAYIKDEILAETASATGEYAGGTRASLDDVGRNVMDWLEVTTKSGRLKQLKETLRKNGIIFDNTGEYSAVLGAQMSPETLAMMRQYQRGLKDFDGTMNIQQSRESDEPDIPLTKVLGSVALQNKYRHADFFEKEQIIKATAPDGSVTEIVVPAGAKIDPFIDVYRTQGGQLVDADGNVVTLGPEITFGSMPDGSTFELDTRIARKSNGSPIVLTNREMKARARKRTEIIQTAIDSAKDDGSGLRLSDTGNGNYRGVMSPAQIAAFMSLPNEVVSPNLKRMTKFFNELVSKNDGTRVIMEYQAALLNGKYKALSPKIRDEVPIGFQLTKNGNFLVTTISVSRLYDKMQAWADKRPFNLTLWNGDADAFWASTMKYLENHAKGEKGETGLHPDSYIAGRMKNRINDLFNAYNAETKQSNPERSTLPRARGKDNLDTVIRGRRLDRINNFSESPSLKIPINYGYLTTNYMPAANPMAAPMTAEEVQNRFDGSVTASRVRQAMATGEVDALESELRQMDDLLPTESLQLVQAEGEMPRIQIVSMFDPENVASLEPEEIVSDIDAETEAELAILDAQDGTAPPQDIAKVLSFKLDQLYADGGRSPIIPALESELEKINQQLESQAQLIPQVRAEFIPPATDEIIDRGISYMPEESFDNWLNKQGEFMYHGSPNAESLEKSGFDLSKAGSTSGYKGVYGTGIYLTNELERAELYGKPIDIRISPDTKLWKIEAKDAINNLFTSATKYGDPDLIRELAINKGYDGIEITNSEVGAKETVIFDPSKIKTRAQLETQFNNSFTGTQYMPAEDPFYSRLQRGIQESQQATYSPDQAKALARKSTNADELKWSGIENAIDSIAEENNGKVPKQALLKYMANEGKVKFEEVILAENAPESPEKPKYGPSGMNKVLPGGENYREIVLAMPGGELLIEKVNSGYDVFPENREFIQNFSNLDEAEQWAKKNKRGSNYTSSHFSNIPNYVAHIRLNERKDAEGKEGLFIEEIQSDRHQQGREYGYKSDIPKFDPAKLTVEKVPEGGYTAFNVYYDGVLVARPPSFAAKTEEDAARIGREAVELGSDLNAQGKIPIPDAPFRKDWPLQMFKRALRDAVASGKEWIGWTDGATQADRYDLSKQVDMIRATKWDDGDYVLKVYKNGYEIVDYRKISAEELPNMIGKELSKKVINQAIVTESAAIDFSGWVELSGLDLKVGGEGMKGFYDTILPKEIGKYVGKIGGKVEKNKIEAQPSDVAPKLNEFTDIDFDTFGGAEGFPSGDNPLIGEVRLHHINTDKNFTIVADQSGFQILDENGEFYGLQKEFQTAEEARNWFNENYQDGSFHIELSNQNRGEYFTEPQQQDFDYWKVNITPEMAATVRKGQPQYLPSEYSDEYGLEEGQEAETRLTPRTLYNLYYIATEPEPTSEYGREITNEYIDKYKRLYVDVFSNLVRQQIQKYIGRGRVDSNVTKKSLDKADTPAMLDELMRGTYRSDMRRRNDVWNIVTDHLKNLASAKTKKDKIFYMDRLNNSIHNTQELLFSKFSNYRQLQEAFDSIHNARDTRAYSQRVDKDLRESNSFNTGTAYLPYVEYELPKDPRKIMADFYLLTSVGDKAGYFGKDWQKIKGGQMPTITGLRYEEYGQNLEDAVGKLTEQMKRHMSDSLLFSISAELRHALERSQPDELMNNPFMKAYREYYESYEKLKNVNLTPLIEKNLQGIYPEGKRARITKGSSKEYQASNKAVRKALEETGISLQDFSEIAENIFRKGRWATSYGGQPWGNIAEGLRVIANAETTGDMVMAMDNAYDLQHNTATVFNKIKKYQREGGYKWLQDMLDFKYHAMTPRELVPLASSAAKRIASPALLDIGDPAMDKSRENAVAASSEELVSGVEAAIGKLKENQEDVYNDIWVKAQKGSGKDINEELFKWLRAQMPARKDELEAVGVNKDLIRYARLLLAEKMAPIMKVPSDIKEMVARSIKEQKERNNDISAFISGEDKKAKAKQAEKTPDIEDFWPKSLKFMSPSEIDYFKQTMKNAINAGKNSEDWLNEAEMYWSKLKVVYSHNSVNELKKLFDAEAKKMKRTYVLKIADAEDYFQKAIENDANYGWKEIVDINSDWPEQLVNALFQYRLTDQKKPEFLSLPQTLSIGERTYTAYTPNKNGDIFILYGDYNNSGEEMNYDWTGAAQFKTANRTEEEIISELSEWLKGEVDYLDPQI